MNLNEIKKTLYKEKPVAERIFSNDNIWDYACTLAIGRTIFFKVPVSEMGETPFELHMPAQLLIRWIEL